MPSLKDLQKLEKKQEKIVELKKAYVKKAKEKGDIKAIEKAEAEEAMAIATLENIIADKKRQDIDERIFEYVKRDQPTEVKRIAVRLDLPIETVEEHIKSLGLVKDEKGNIFINQKRMVAIKSIDWSIEKDRASKRWNEILHLNPGLTKQELKGIYVKHYPNDAKILERFLEEKERESKEAEKIKLDKSQHILGDIHDILLVFLIIGLIVIVVSCLGTCV